MVEISWWWFVYRLISQAALIIGVLMLLRRVGALLEQGQDDARARLATAERLEQVTADLTIRTQRALDEHNEKMLTKLDETKESAVLAASESRHAAAVANTMNEKIHDTNTRILEQAHTSAVLQQAEATKEIIQHIDATHVVGEATLEKAITVDKKVDTLLDAKVVIDATHVIGEATLDKTTTVDEKVDTSLDSKKLVKK